jgi:small GTP-binding protein
MNTVIQKKICMLGDLAVGKTSLIERYVHNRYDERYMATIGIKVSRKEMVINGGTNLNLLLWDMAGEERFSKVKVKYLQGASGTLVVCDLTRLKTLSTLKNHIAYLRVIVPEAQVILVGNKSDLVNQRKINENQLRELGEMYNAPVAITSAKTGEGVEKAFSILAERLLEKT